MWGSRTKGHWSKRGQNVNGTFQFRSVTGMLADYQYHRMNYDVLFGTAIEG